MSLVHICDTAEKCFSLISPDKSNSQVVWDTLDIKSLVDYVISRVRMVEKDLLPVDLLEDKELFRTFDKLFTSGIILLPLDTVERVRWVALICAAICINEGYSYGNVLSLVDYLPDEQLAALDFLGETEKVMRFRKKVANHGWKSLFV